MDKDVTELVVWDWQDGDVMSLVRCVCGNTKETYVKKKDALYGVRNICECGRELYFDVRVYEVEK